MAWQLKDLMTHHVHTVPKEATVREVANTMLVEQIGLVIVNSPDGTMFGVATDRDLVVRALAKGRDVDHTKIADVCSRSVSVLGPTATIEDALKLMRDRAVRRIPIVVESKVLGVISIGDLARAKDPHSTLAQISASPAND